MNYSALSRDVNCNIIELLQKRQTGLQFQIFSRSHGAIVKGKDKFIFPYIYIRDI